MTDIAVSDNASARLAAMGGAVREALAASTAALAAQLQGAVDDALSGGVLQSRSGALRDSIRLEIEPGDGRFGASLGSDLAYAGFQEFGFTGSEQVREHLRRQSVAFGRPMTPRDVLVRAYGRQLDYAGRSYLAGPLAAMADDIAATYETSVREALGR